MFTPSIAYGALIGGAYGSFMHALWPRLASPYGAYAAVGMAAVMAGTSYAPISAILIIFEFTGNYDLILPVMLAAILSSLLARTLHPYSIYTESLRGKGIDLRMEEAVLAGLKARNLMRPDPQTLRRGEAYSEVVRKFLATPRQRLFVVGDDGRLLGAVSLHDIKYALENPETLTAVVALDLMTPVDRVIHPDERLHLATEIFARSDYERLPVIDDTGKFLGILAKRDLLAVYAQEVVGRTALLTTFVSSRDAQANRQYVEIPPDFALRLVPVPPHLVGKTLAEARLPQTLGARVMEIRRRGELGEEPVLPEAGTLLETGDLLLQRHGRGAPPPRKARRPPRPLRHLRAPAPRRLPPQRLRALRAGRDRSAVPEVPAAAGAGVSWVRVSAVNACITLRCKGEPTHEENVPSFHSSGRRPGNHLVDLPVFRRGSRSSPSLHHLRRHFLPLSGAGGDRPVPGSLRDGEHLLRLPERLPRRAFSRLALRLSLISHPGILGGRGRYR